MCGRCPLCRTVLHVGRELPVTLTLKNILQRAFPEDYAQRQVEELQHSAADQAEQAPVPLFVLSCLLPGATLVQVAYYCAAGDHWWCCCCC